MHLSGRSNNLQYVNQFEPLLSIVMDLLEFEPKPLSEIVRVLAQNGIISNLDSPSDDLTQLLDESDAIWGSASGLYNRTDKMLDGLCLTHRISSAEIENDLVHIIPDLDGLAFNLDSVFIWENQELRVVYRTRDGVENAATHGSYLGPIGWLREFSPGDVIAFRRNGNVLSAFRPRDLYRGDEEQAALLRAFTNLYAGSKGVEPMEVLLDALCEDPSLFRLPVPPIQELTQSLLLEPRGIWLGPSMEDWNTPDEAWQTEKKAKIAESLGFERCCVKEFDNALAAWKKWRRSKHAEVDYKAVLNSLSHGQVAKGFTSWVFQFETFPHRSVEAFITDLVASGGSKAAAGYYVRAISRALEGKAILAEKDLKLALQYDSKFDLARVELANTFADRGDIHGYIAALKQCEPTSVLPLIAEAESLLPHFGPTDRDELCPCGSGLKYKYCCLKSPKLSPSTRIRWIMQKVIRWMTRPERRENISDFFLSFNQMLAEPVAEDYGEFVLDVAVFEGGGIEEYVDLRKELLSPIDRQLLEELAASKRALLEIADFSWGRSLSLRDTLTGDRIVVSEPPMSLDSKIGDYLMARVVNTGEGHALAGKSLPIFLRQRDGLLELLRHSPEPFDFLRWFASTLSPSDPGAFEEPRATLHQLVLTARTESRMPLAVPSGWSQIDNGTWIFSQSSERSQLPHAVRILMKDDAVVIQATSAELTEVVLEDLRRRGGRFEVVDRSTDEIKLKVESFTGRMSVRSRAGAPDATSAASDSYIELMEAVWPDLPLPALGGLSPKQALEDLTRREDLIRILNEFEKDDISHARFRTSASRSLNANRLREKLGL